MPAYNGGLFDRARASLLVRTMVPDAVMAPIIALALTGIALTTSLRCVVYLSLAGAIWLFWSIAAHDWFDMLAMSASVNNIAFIALPPMLLGWLGSIFFYGVASVQ